jgi:ABC-type sugar transport system substrate-binding protein
MDCGAQEEAARLGYQLTTQAPDRFEAALQTPIVTDVLATRPVGVLIAPTDDVPLANSMTQLKDAGINVVEVDTRLQGESVALSTVSSNNEQGGVLAAQTVAELIGGQGCELFARMRTPVPFCVGSFCGALDRRAFFGAVLRVRWAVSPGGWRGGRVGCR